MREDGLPNIDWRRIDGGDMTIEIRANLDELNSEVINRLTRSVVPFRVARYPITIAQLRAFLDECHRDGE